MWRYYHSSETHMDRLNLSFGTAVPKILLHFLTLGASDLDVLLAEYGRANGAAAEKYARQTYPSWKRHSVKLSGKVMERLIVLVPPFLSPDQRYGLLQDVLKAHQAEGGKNTHVDIAINAESPESGFAEVGPKLDQIQHTDALAYLPESVMETARWLYDNDMTTARAMLARATRTENELAKKNAEREIRLLHQAVRTGQVHTASYYAAFPAGGVSIRVFTPPKPLMTQVMNTLRALFN